MGMLTPLKLQTISATFDVHHFIICIFITLKYQHLYFINVKINKLTRIGNIVSTVDKTMVTDFTC